MSLLCGCAGRSSTRNSPRRNTGTKSSSDSKMSRIKPPSTGFSSRFGFNHRRSASPLTDKENKASEHVAPPPGPPTQSSASNSHSSINKPTFAEVLTLSPCALLKESKDYHKATEADDILLLENSHGDGDDFVPRRLRPRNPHERPLSTIVTISQTEGIPVDTPGQRSLDDTNPSGGYKSGLKSFLARSFNRTPNTSKSSPTLTGSNKTLSSTSSNGSSKNLFYGSSRKNSPNKSHSSNHLYTQSPNAARRQRNDKSPHHTNPPYGTTAHNNNTSKTSIEENSRNIDPYSYSELSKPNTSIQRPAAATSTRTSNIKSISTPSMSSIPAPSSMTSAHRSANHTTYSGKD